jgi:hypothetical protein
LPIVALGLIGFVIARQLTAYQLGHVDGVWEPFFHGEAGRNGTETVITSDVSKAWPIADAGLVAVSYMFEVLMGVMGDRRRWRTMPWMVMAFGIVVVPLGVVSIYFIIIQPIVIGTFINVGFGLWLVAAPWLLDGGSTLAAAAGVVVGLAVVALSLPRGKRSTEHYGSWDRWVL